VLVHGFNFIRGYLRKGDNLRLGILGTSDIAFRRFLPALGGSFDFAGVASRDLGKTAKFTDAFGGVGYDGYDALLNDETIGAVYIPLPPALHFEWAEKALLNGKHVMLEKPFTTRLSDTQALVELAKSKGLALHENYMFVYHSQLDFIRGKMNEIGELRLIRCDFGFPFRGNTDFRYDKNMGGGALLDCGGYTLKLAAMLLGSGARVTAAGLNYKPQTAFRPGFNVDIGGSATLVNKSGVTAQVCFGMDNSYRCSLDIWGSKGAISTDRIFTAPDGFETTVTVNGEGYKLEADSCMRKSIEYFAETITDSAKRGDAYINIQQQAELVHSFLEVAE
jgi:predicted dehydrogenase